MALGLSGTFLLLCLATTMYKALFPTFWRCKKFQNRYLQIPAQSLPGYVFFCSLPSRCLNSGEAEKCGLQSSMCAKKIFLSERMDLIWQMRKVRLRATSWKHLKIEDAFLHLFRLYIQDLIVLSRDYKAHEGREQRLFEWVTEQYLLLWITEQHTLPHLIALLVQ